MQWTSTEWTVCGSTTPGSCPRQVPVADLRQNPCCCLVAFLNRHRVDRVWIDHPWFLSKASACCRFAPKSLLLPRGSFKQAHSGPCVDRPPLVPFQGTLQVDGSRKEALVILLLSLLDDWTVGGWLDHPLHFCSSVELCSFV